MANYEWSNKEKFIADMRQSHGISDFMDKRGIVATSGNDDTFKKWIRFHGLKKEDYFQEKPQIKKPEASREKRLTVHDVKIEEVLCLNSKYTRKEAQKVVIANKLLPYQCRGCSNLGSWQSKPLRLQLEHKNGESTDHRIENLEYLCPNCHTQTPTYGSKNKHRKVFEERIKDLLLFKIINDVSIHEISLKWKAQPEGTRQWINKYAEKIKSYGIVVQKIKKIKIVKKNEKQIVQIEKRMKDMEDVNGKLNLENILMKEWQVCANAVKKWIKNNNLKFYNDNYVLTNRYKLKKHYQEKENNIRAIIMESKDLKFVSIEKILPLFGNNKAACYSYIKRKFPLEYKQLFKIPDCSNNALHIITREGIIKKKGIPSQRYRCQSCRNYFY